METLKKYQFIHYYRGKDYNKYTINDIIDLQNNNDDDQNNKIFNLYEIIKSDNPCMIYFDFDYDVLIENKKIIVDNEFYITSMIIKAIEKTLIYYNLIDLYDKKYKLYLSLSSGIKNNDGKKYKYSLHTIIRDIGYIEQNHYIKLHIINKLNDFLLNTININDKNLDIKADTEVYKGFVEKIDNKTKKRIKVPGEQKFRCLNSFKETWIDMKDENGNFIYYKIDGVDTKVKKQKIIETKNKRFSRDITLDYNSKKIIYNSCNKELFENHLITNISTENKIINIQNIINKNNKENAEKKRFEDFNKLLENNDDDNENENYFNIDLNNDTKNNDVKDFIFILKNLNKERAENYGDWIKICFILYNHFGGENDTENDGYKLFIQFSQQSDKFDLDENYNLYFNCKKRNLTIKTLLLMLKNDNLQVFNNYIKEKNIIFTDKDREDMDNIAKYLKNDNDVIKIVDNENEKNIDEIKIDENDLKKYICENSCFDRYDQFCWADLCFYLSSNIFRNEKDMKKYIIQNLPRVLARIRTGKDKIIFKSDCEDLLYNIEKFTNAWTDQNIKYILYDKVKTVKLTNIVNDLAQFLPLYKRIECEADINKIKKHTFNVYENYIAEKVIYEINEIKPLLDFIMLVWCNNEERLYNYFMKWLAFIIQNPCEKSGVAIVGLSIEGTGKNTLSDFLAEYIFGKKKSLPNINSIEKLVGEKNNQLINKRFVVVNEMASTKEEFRSNFDKMKSIITDKTLNIRPLYQEPFDIQQYIELMMFSNNFDSIILSKNDRRYFILKINEIYLGNKLYFNKLKKIIMNKTFGDKFYSYMMDYDCSDFQLLNIPMTEIKENIIETCAPSYVKFFDSLKEQILLDNNDRDQFIRNKIDDKNISIIEENQLEIKLKASIIFDLYKNYCTDKQEKNILNQKKFSNGMQSLLKLKKYKDGMYYIFTINKN